MIWSAKSFYSNFIFPLFPFSLRIIAVTLSFHKLHYFCVFLSSFFFFIFFHFFQKKKVTANQTPNELAISTSNHQSEISRFFPACQENYKPLFLHSSPCHRPLKNIKSGWLTWTALNQLSAAWKREFANCLSNPPLEVHKDPLHL